MNMPGESLTEAINLIKAGKKAEAQKLLEPFIEANPQNIAAWMWEAETWPTAAGKIKVLELCLQRNPGNSQVKQRLDKLKNPQTAKSDTPIAPDKQPPPPSEPSQSPQVEQPHEPASLVNEKIVETNPITGDDMAKWEYYSEFMYAKAEEPDVKKYLHKRWPNIDFPKYAPQAMLLRLNELGGQGRKLVHMVPVQNVGSNDDVGFVTSATTNPMFTGGAAFIWSNAYFCVLRRPQPE